MSPELSVVISSLNGAAGVSRCLRALARQTIWPAVEVIVVDDGSDDSTTEVALAQGATVIRHPANLGVSAARNSGVAVASAPVVAFLDDDCEPEPRWAERLLASYHDQVVGVGGPLLVTCESRLLRDFLSRNNPLDPLEIELTTSEKPLYRLGLYLRRQWNPVPRGGARAVYSLASANLSVRRSALVGVGGFDEDFRFGSEDEDLCRRLRIAYPAQRLLFAPDARVAHHFDPSLRDTLRRRLAYGTGSASLRRKWPDVLPTIFPGPILVGLALAATAWLPIVFGVAVVLPTLIYPRGVRAAITGRDPRCLLDAYLSLLQETCDDLGFLRGIWRLRRGEVRPDACLARQQIADASRGVRRDREVV